MLQKRIIYAQKYLEFLHSSFEQDWLRLYEDYVDNKLEFFNALALIHPRHYEGLFGEEQIRGKRTFDKDMVLEGIECRAELIWGYRCNLDCNKRGVVVADHLFPYSLGGPTISTNKVYLCSIHNQLKGSDIHFYPWELGNPGWLKDRINRVAQLKQQMPSR